ncbi:MAG: hypothetical protein AB7F75_02830, partial [Planctomycetota bacterium]
IQTPSAPSAKSRGMALLILTALTSFAVVGVAATGLIKSVITLSAHFGIPEYILTFFGASLGTSLPELSVVVAALRGQQRKLALGDIFGACMIDSTLSIGIGPILFPVAVSADLAVKGSLVAIAALSVGGILLASRQRHDKFSGILLILCYIGAYFIVI